MNKLDKAIEIFEDETLDLTLGERISLLREALMWNAHAAMKRINKNGLKDQLSAEEDYKQTECVKWFKELEKLYNAQLKTNKLSGKSNDNMDKDFLKKIKEQKSSIGDVIATIPIYLSNGN